MGWTAPAVPLSHLTRQPAQGGPSCKTAAHSNTSLSILGYTPAAVVETSPGSFQAWLRHTQPLSKELGTLAAKTLAKQFCADASAADWRRFGRAPGFTNRKPQHRKPQGLYPFARLHAAIGEIFPEPDTFRARLLVLQQKAEDERTALRLSFAARPFSTYIRRTVYKAMRWVS